MVNKYFISDRVIGINVRYITWGNIPAIYKACGNKIIFIVSSLNKNINRKNVAKYII